MSGTGRPPSSLSTRTVGDLFKRARKTEKEAERKAGEEAERKQIQRLEKLALEEETTWKNVENLLSLKRGSAYDEATRLLVELHAMAEYKQRKNSFSKHFKEILEKYGKSRCSYGSIPSRQIAMKQGSCKRVMPRASCGAFLHPRQVDIC